MSKADEISTKELIGMIFVETRRLSEEIRVVAWQRDICRRFKVDPMRMVNHEIARGLRKQLKRRVEDGVMGLRGPLGHDIDILHDHLARQLPSGSTMSDLFNGRLHIDHIVPISSFDMTSDADLMACWHLSNLRPLAANDNMRKGGKRTHLV